MDFTLIKDHPWTTAGIVLGGGVLLFVVMRKGGSSAAAPTYAAGATATDPNAAALASQQLQVQAYSSGLQLQGATQISLAQIGADVSRFGTTAAVDVTNRQTDAQVALGLGTISATVQQAQISAGIQSKYIDAIIAAFTGSNPSSTATPNSPNPTVQNPTPTIVYLPSSGGTGGAPPVGVGGVNPGTAYPGMPTPGSAPLQYNGGPILAPPSYANCDPRDSACVMRNQDLSIGYFTASATAEATNNRNQCLANASLSQGRPGYAQLVSACG
jgi:hypothetical protein